MTRDVSGAFPASITNSCSPLMSSGSPNFPSDDTNSALNTACFLRVTATCGRVSVFSTGAKSILHAPDLSTSLMSAPALLITVKWVSARN